MFCSVTARYPASHSKHVLFWRETRGLPTTMVNFLQFSGRKVKNKTDPGIKQKVHLMGLFTK